MLPIMKTLLKMKVFLYFCMNEVQRNESDHNNKLKYSFLTFLPLIPIKK